jgi:hypothetical protein
MMKVRVRLRGGGLARLRERLGGLSGAGGVEIGFPEDGEHYSGYSMAGLAGLLTRGYVTSAPHGGAPVSVPARPFVKQFVEQHLPEIERMVNEHMERYLAGAGTAGVESAWDAIGSDITAKMRGFAERGAVTPGNTPWTLRRKGCDKPYVYHGDLVGSIRHVVLRG